MVFGKTYHDAKNLEIPSRRQEISPHPPLLPNRITLASFSIPILRSISFLVPTLSSPLLPFFPLIGTTLFLSRHDAFKLAPQRFYSSELVPDLYRKGKTEVSFWFERRGGERTNCDDALERSIEFVDIVKDVFETLFIGGKGG